MRILIILITTLGLILPAYADLAVHDLPYLEGTPLDQTSEDSTWILLDYEQADDGFAWAWLENAGLLAYVVYPSSSEAVVFPDGTSVDSDPENMVLRFLGDEEQQLEFFRFGDATFTLGGKEIEVRYGLIGNSDEGIYVGDISVQADIIEIDLAAEIDGNLALTAHNHLAVYGFVDLLDNHLSAYATSNLITGKILSSEGVLNICETNFETLPATINIGTPGGSKQCYGDFVPTGTNASAQTSEPIKTPAAVSQTSGNSKGGNTSGLLFGLLTLLALFRRKN